MKNKEEARQAKQKKREEKRKNSRRGKLRQKIKTMYTGSKTKVMQVYANISNKVMSSIRLEILYIVVLSLFISSLVGMGITKVATSAGVGERSYVEYNESRQQLQNRLVSAVQEITNIEQIKVKFNINTEEIRNIIATNNTEEGAYQLQNTLQYMYEVQENGDYYSGYYGDREVSLEKYEALYIELDKILKEVEWEETKVRDILVKFMEEELGLKPELLKVEVIESIISNIDSGYHNVVETQTYIIDNQGNTFFEDSFIKSINIVQAIEKSSEGNNYYDSNSITSIYPVIINDEIHYLFNESILRGNTEYYHTGTAQAMGWIGGTLLFVLLILQFTKSKLRYIEYISHCLEEISKGDLSYQVDVIGQDELAKVAADIAYMEEQIKNQIEAQIQAEKTKNELITNVAHDLRTPLTSIIGYIGLVKDKKFSSEEEYEKYLDIAYSKSEKLKVLIDDLFEYTKLNNQAVTLKKQSVSLSNLMNQLLEELMPIAEDKQVTIETHINVADTTIQADIAKITRVFENLVENAIKYTDVGAVVHVDMQEVGSEIYISIRNKCSGMTNEDIGRMFDRFYRSDASRNSTTGGSGLGLAIAKNIIKLHGGEIWAQLNENIISLNVRLKK